MSMLTRYAPGGTGWFMCVCVGVWGLATVSEAQFPAAPCRQDEVYGWVAELPNRLATCPSPSNRWQLRTFPLNEDGSRTLCSYEWRSAATPTRVGLPIGLHYSADCMAVGVWRKEHLLVPQPDGATTSDVAAVESDFLDAVDAPMAWSRARANIRDGRTKLAFIDALPVNENGPQDGSIQHGNSLATLARLIGLCTDQSCRYDYGWFGPPALFPYVRGDVAGSPLDSAQAILATLERYRAAPGEHLVLSMGLGFEPDAGCAALPDSPVVSALREAIRRVACETDAIVLAPVGNKRADDVGTGMMYPAAFANEELECVGEPQGRPLVVAISGVDFALRPLESSRANTPLMTIGGPFAYEGKTLADQLNPRVGSSVAVAAAGPIVSMAWYLRPELDAGGLVQALSQAGTKNTSGSRVIRACSAWQNLCKDKRVGRCRELSDLCSGVSAQTERALPLIAAPSQPEPEDPAPRSDPDYCLGRGQRIEPSGPGE